ncbi:hypothetical protein H8788_12610 [Parabacteroides faecis]|nr:MULTISPECIES: hypothetical protein [Parabacteroides]MBC8618587.1 hypothetical protein [Parabacteroides faecis]
MSRRHAPVCAGGVYASVCVICFEVSRTSVPIGTDVLTTYQDSGLV